MTPRSRPLKRSRIGDRKTPMSRGQGFRTPGTPKPTASRRAMGLSTRTAIRKRAKTKSAKRAAREDHTYRRWIRTQPCHLAGRWSTGPHPVRHVCAGRIEAAHVLNVGRAGPDRANLLPFCRIGAHQDGPFAQHTMGTKAFARFWGLDLAAEARGYEALYLGSSWT